MKGFDLWDMASVGKLVHLLVINKKFMWLKWVYEVYLKGYNFWAHRAPTDSSWYWRKLNFLKERMQHWYA